MCGIQRMRSWLRPAVFGPVRPHGKPGQAGEPGALVPVPIGLCYHTRFLELIPIPLKAGLF
jgi:hypothetical protein